MASLTKAQLANRVLEHLGVKAAGQAASAEDSGLVEEAIDACHDELRKEGLAPFATSAVPTWAQNGLRDFVVAEVAGHFGIPVDKRSAQAAARKRLNTQVSGFKHPLRIVTDYF